MRWKTEIPGEGSSSPIVSGNRIFVCASRKAGEARLLHALDRESGKLLWTKEIADENPEISSAVTGYAAATPAADGQRVVVLFGNAGTACFDYSGKLLWRRTLGEFDSELGLASSPVIAGERVLLLCDHDGDRTRSFDSFLTALAIRTGEPLWRANRPGLYRSWSTPFLVPAPDCKQELVVNAQDELRGYDPETGKMLWRVAGMTGWVTPTPVFGLGLIFATSGKDGPIMAVRPGGRGDVTETHVAWSEKRGGPYVCSPLLYQERLYVHTESGQITCFEALTGKRLFRARLPGKFTASALAGADHVYLLSETGACHVLKAGPTFEEVALNRIEEDCYASPAAAGERLYLRTEKHLWCLGNK